MTDLARLLDETPMEEEGRFGARIVIRMTPKVGCRFAPYDQEVWAEELRDYRVHIARETAEACAKLMCEYCASEVPLAKLTYENTAQRHTFVDGRTDRYCFAAPIRNALTTREGGET